MKQLKGRKYIALLRCSTANQSEKSIPDQRALVQSFAEEHGLIHVGDEILEGLSGSKPALRKDIGKLLDRKRTSDDFELIVVHDLSRFTRGGSLHGRHVEAEFAKLGVEILSATDTIPTGSGVASSMLRSFYYDMAHEGAKQMGQKSARGWVSSVLSEQITPYRIPPYGTDKLYVSLDGKTKFHIIRNLADGSQVRLHPDTLEVLATYSHLDGTCGYYKRQANEKVVLIPGSPDRVDTVRRIYAEYFINGYGYGRIAKRLIADGIPSAKGREWSMTTIKKIIENPVYTGRLIGARYTNAWHYSMGRDGPVEVEGNDQALLTLAHKKFITRPKEDWLEFESEELSSFLDPVIKQLAQVRQAAYEDGSRKPLAFSNRKKDAGFTNAGVHDKHVDSGYILKDILRLKQGMVPMRGQTASNKGSPYRYYRSRNGAAVEFIGTARAAMIPAEPLENAVLDVLGRILDRIEDIRPTICNFVRNERESVAGEAMRLESIITERKAVARKLATTLDLISGLDDDEFSGKATALRTKLQDLDALIARASRPVLDSADEEAVADSVIMQFRDIRKVLEAGAIGPLKRVLAILISDMTVDGETRETSLTFRLPSWALSLGDELTQKVCLDNKIPYYHEVEAKSVLLAQVSIWPQDKYNRGRAKSWRFAVTDGIIPCNQPKVPEVPANYASIAPTVRESDSEPLALPAPVQSTAFVPIGDMVSARPGAFADAVPCLWPILQPFTYAFPQAA